MPVGTIKKANTRRRYKPSLIIEAIVEAHGLLSDAARALGCSRKTLYSYMDEFPEVREAYEDANEKTKDFAESKLFDAISKGNITAIIFYLKTKAKDRGYIERQELTGAEGADLSIDIKWADRTLDE